MVYQKEKKNKNKKKGFSYSCRSVNEEFRISIGNQHNKHNKERT